MVVKVPLYRSSYIIYSDSSGLSTDLWHDYVKYYMNYCLTLDLSKVGQSGWLYICYYMQSPTEYNLFIFLIYSCLKYLLILIFVISILLVVFGLIIFFLLGEYAYLLSEWKKTNKVTYKVINVLLNFDKFLKFYKIYGIRKSLRSYRGIFEESFEDFLYMDDYKEMSDEVLLYFEMVRNGFYDYDYGICLSNDSYNDFVYHSYKVDGYKLDDEEVSVDDDEDEDEDEDIDENEKFEIGKKYRYPTLSESIFFGKSYTSDFKQGYTFWDQVKESKKRISEKISTTLFGKGEYRVIIENFRKEKKFIKRDSIFIKQEYNYKIGSEDVSSHFNRKIRYMSFSDIYYSGRPLLLIDCGLKSYYEKEAIDYNLYKNIEGIFIMYGGIVFILTLILFSYKLFILSFLGMVLIYILLSCFSSHYHFMNSFAEDPNQVDEKYSTGNLNYVRIGLSEDYYTGNTSYQSDDNYYYRDLLVLLSKRSINVGPLDFEILDQLAMNKELSYLEPSGVNNLLLWGKSYKLNFLFFKKLEKWLLVLWSEELNLNKIKDFWVYKTDVFKNYLTYNNYKVFRLYRLDKFLIFILITFMFFYSEGLINFLLFMRFLKKMFSEFFELLYSVIEWLIILIQTESSRPIPIIESRKIIIPNNFFEVVLIFIDFISDYLFSGIILVLIFPYILVWFYIYIFLK